MSFNQRIIEEFRANGGRVGGPFEGAELILLTATGARTGEPRTSPLGFVRDGDRLLVVASAAGAPAHPAWFHNLVANPRVTVELGDGVRVATHEMIAVPATGAERDRLFARVVDEAPGYADYQAATSRVLPVVVLHPVDRAEVERLRAVGDELVKIHDWFRAELATLRTEPLDVALRTRCMEFCAGLERHHTGEDAVVFPHLQRLFPELGPALRTLRDEHHVVSRIRADLHASLADGEVRPGLDELADELIAHLDREEALLVPIMNTLGDAPWPDVSG